MLVAISYFFPLPAIRIKTANLCHIFLVSSFDCIDHPAVFEGTTVGRAAFTGILWVVAATGEQHHGAEASLVRIDGDKLRPPQFHVCARNALACTP